MNSTNKFASLETTCRERTALAKRKWNYWLVEAEEWRRLKEAPGLSFETMPVQLDWCTEFGGDY
jgi:hypothetical protein